MDRMNLIPYIEDERLYDYAVSCARTLRPDGCGDGKAEALALHRCRIETERCHALLQKRYADKAQIPAACEWLLDNRYMLQREYPPALRALREAERQRRCRRELLVTGLCRMLLQAGNGRLTAERCALFLAGFQSVTALQRRELGLFPAALHAAVLEAIAGLCRRLKGAADPEPLTDSMAALFGSLRLLATMDMEALLDGADLSGAVLALDPSGEYAQMDRVTKNEYLRRLERMARGRGLEEQTLARELLERARREGRHIGFLLFDPPREGRAALYIGALFLLTLFISLCFAIGLSDTRAALLLLIPVWSLVKGFADFVLLRLIPPRPLPRLDMAAGVPERGRTICVMSVLLGCCDPEKLEELHLVSRREGRALSFGLLADLPAARTETTDADAALLAEAGRAVERLNEKYGGGFYLFTRARSFDGEGYSARERKRGALLELAKLLCGEDSALSVTGDAAALAGTRYIISLDADTRVYPGALGELIGAMLHPLNRPQLDRGGRVCAGHALVHPRIETELESATATDFSLIFAGPGGCDPYGGLSGELYMDAFGSGGFAGKGILDAALLLRCSEKLPEGRILSHDAIEGAYLRGAYMSDAAFSDAFPARPLAYYKRLQRWIRGDWQNARWIFARELAAIDRFRLLDSLRRSLVAPMTLLAILCGFFPGSLGLAAAAWAALLALMQSLLLSFAESGLRHTDSGGRLRRHTRLLTGVGGAIVRCFMRLWLLPYEAWVSLTAIFTALWRMLVSHRRLLQWQTFAEAPGGTGLAAHVRAMWPAVALGVLLMGLAPAIIGKASGLMWLLSPAAAAALALPAAREKALSVRDRDLILTAVTDAWGYLREQSNADNNFLPPDNFQQQPPVGAAQRSSPTNIGLALASAAALAESGVIAKEEAAAYIGRALDSLERMERHLGHFYNWYDTRTLRPLRPRYLSTVDSGNLCAGLITARSALLGWGETALADRLGALLDAMDFGPLFDTRRELFYICYDAEKERGAGGWYDLMASEAMLTSYLTLARGGVPLRHWRRLSRAQLQKDGFRGLASWTGTMFEYLMPALFLPLYRSSLLHESARFCLYAQRRRHFPGKPWGTSESAFYALDAALSYRYKAHGCPALALRRGLERDMVISPYSSFLALAADSAAAARNLRLLKELGAYGRWGFIEALDFTPGRCARDDGEQVRCWMAHHVGMSILAGLNAVDGDVVRRLFMAAPEMAAYTLLLQEKLPDSAGVIRRDTTRVPERRSQPARSPWQRRGDGHDNSPHACLLSNGAYSLRLTQAGESAAFLGPLCIYRADRQSAGLTLELDGLPLYPAEKASSWEFGEEQARWSYLREGLSLTLERQSAAGELGESLKLTLRCKASRRLALTLGLRPILAAERDWDSHSAYWKLGVTAQEREGRLLLRRLSKQGGREQWLCLAATAPLRLDADARGGLGTLITPLVRAGLSLPLTAELPAVLRFALCLGESAEAAFDGAERILCSTESVPGSMLRAAAERLGMSAAELDEAMALVLPLWQNRLRNAAPRAELWRWGISGELPILCCDALAAERDRLLRAFCLLKSCGMEAELVFLSGEQGEYHQPALRELSRQLAGYGLEALIGSPGGVLIAPMEAADTVKSRSAVVIGEDRPVPAPLPRLLPRCERRPGALPPFGWEAESFFYGPSAALPPRIWQHVLCGGSGLGAFAADFGPAGLWFRNARETRLLPPPEDIADTACAEALCAFDGERPVSLFADGESQCYVNYSPGCALWRREIAGRTVETVMFLPPETDLRLLLIRGAEGLGLVWDMEPLLGGPDGACVRMETVNGTAALSSSESYLEGLRMLVSASVPCRFETDFSPAALRVTLRAAETTVLACGVVPEEVLRAALDPAAAEAMLAETRSYWRGLLRRFRLRCGDAALEHMMNGWALYQCRACRLGARSSIYQSGGAIGFRDQLQDCVNLLLLDPAPARAQILDCCRHQYREGDVMHWWHRHPEGDRGVRTRCSDDLLWLVWALCEYVEATGELALCRAEESWLDSPALAPEERDRYERAARTGDRAPVLEHAAAALDRCEARGFGEHGLPFIGSGDWNDGLDRVGGESVWLGWFLSCCALRFSALLEKLGDPRAAATRALSERVGRAADAAFNGRWYLRAWTAEGRPLGDGERIDSLTQSWAVFCPWAAPGKREAAIDSALARLVDREHGIVRLLDPPYGTQDSPGYLSGYGEGLRENGGQYTHGAIWLAMAALRLGRREAGLAILRMLLPETHDPARYEAEPFVLPADVSAAAGREGIAGWTWYTGSAGWYFRAVCEELLGLSRRDGELCVRPGALARYRVRLIGPDGRAHELVRENGALSLDGRIVP